MKLASFGVIGHVDHGKTALVRALTGQDTDRLPEEKRRGVSIALGFAHARIGDAEIDFIDMPGHERFVRTMVSGATGMQAALLVVAANEGVKPQTREHVNIAAALGVERVVVAVTKADLANADAAGVSAQATALLAGVGLRAEPAIAVSSTTGQGLDDLRRALEAAAHAAKPPADDGFGWLPIDRAFSMSGHGVVVTGTLRGRICKGDVLTLAPGEHSVRVRGLQVHGAGVDTAEPGQRVAVNLRGVALECVGRGQALSTPGQLSEARWLTVELTVSPDASELRTGAALTLLVGTSETPVRLRLLGQDRLAPGRGGFAQLHAEEPVALPGRTRFILRRPSPAETIAGGRIIDPNAARLRRNDAAALAHLSDLSRADPTAVAAIIVRQAGAAGLSVGRLSQQLGMGSARLAERLKGASVERAREGVLVDRRAFEAVTQGIHAALAGGSTSLSRLRRAVPAGAPVFDEAMIRLVAAGRLRVEAGSVRAIDAGQEQARAEGEIALSARLAETLRRGGMSPPDLAGEEASREARRAMERLVRQNVAVRTYDRVQKREIVFHREAVEEARRLLAPHLAGEGLKVTEAGAILGVSRKFSVPLLEHLDAIQFTRRAGDRRTLGPGARG